MTRVLAAIAATVALIAGGVALPQAVHAAPSPSVSPTTIVAVGGYTTQVTVTAAGLVARSAVTIQGCESSGTPVAGSGSVTGVTVDAAAGTLTAELGPFEPSTCDLYVTTRTKPTTPGLLVGQITYSATDVAYLTPIGAAPSILPVSGGDASFMVIGSTANPTEPG